MEKTFTLTADGVDFRVHQRGDRPRTVFLHGFAADLHTWDDLWREMGEDLSALRYDQRGFGETPATAATGFSHADDLLAILDTLNIEKCNLVGVSMGGAIALNLALNYPERVDRLVLISPGIMAWEWSEDWKKLWRAITAHARQGEMDRARELWWQHPLFAVTRQSPGAEKLHDSIQRYSGIHWIRDDQRAELPDVDRLHCLEPRTLLLTGEADMEEFRLQAELITASAPDLIRVDFPGLGHLLQLEAPAPCARHVAEFLNGSPKAR